MNKSNLSLVLCGVIILPDVENDLSHSVEVAWIDDKAVFKFLRDDPSLPFETNEAISWAKSSSLVSLSSSLDDFPSAISKSDFAFLADDSLFADDENN